METETRPIVGKSQLSHPLILNHRIRRPIRARRQRLLGFDIRAETGAAASFWHGRVQRQLFFGLLETGLEPGAISGRPVAFQSAKRVKHFSHFLRPGCFSFWSKLV